MTETSYTIDGNESDASSVTLDNEPDRRELLCEQLRPLSPFVPLPREIVDLTDDEAINNGDYMTDDLFAVWQADYQAAFAVNRLLEDVCVDGIVYRPGHSVELHDGLNRSSYLRICSVWEDPRVKDPMGKIFFKGRRLLRTRNHGVMGQPGEGPRNTYIPTNTEWRNELVWIANVDTDIPLALVKRFVTIHFTNDCQVKRHHNINHGSFICRLKETLKTDTTCASVEYLPHEEADVEYRVAPTILRQEWRGDTASFGSEEKQTPIIVLDEDENDHIDSAEQRARRSYTFGDGFCGAGGVSHGAEAAGVHIKWAFDSSPHAIETYRQNFLETTCEISAINDFLTNREDHLRVDITHGSPPCQTWSPAHTSVGVNDDANSACIFSCSNLIRQAKPRVHTMEETAGLFERHKRTFYTVLRDFIETGYSVRWALLRCDKYGVPQSRKRLIIIASGPGETLPRLPQPTHGLPGSGLPTPATINQMISNIPTGTPDHDVESALIRAERSQTWREPFDGNRQANTITCNGGENNYHPSGQRKYTLRELACLQTFPLTFRFGRVETKKQIGNAVPPRFAKAIYKEIIRSLQETDEREMRQIHGL
ncbi:S-adenosyl-L-methionine-dependent methyltransferase [Aspergillus californicus]